ncbi:MAG: polysaccharide deacetylase family protein, partial [Candidatus Levybacteria bacterium]|nr:polysaccharide deacetylase family protein [Candidatus Levybacteria bacterium]
MKSRRGRKTKNKKSSKNFFVLFVLVALVLFSFSFVNFGGIINPINSKKSGEKLISSKSLGNIRLTPPPLTPTPTPFPTPTPVPLVGYCLNVPVLMYHHIQPNAEAQSKGQKALSVDVGAFDLQMGYLVSSGYTVISAGQLTDALLNHTALPQKSIVITMDDGYSDIFIYAYPILQKYNIVANLAVITGLTG